MNNCIKLSENDNILEFNFLNGTIYLDEGRYGAYAMCPGCGSGKTTIIKQLIELKWHEGVLYSAFTKDECNQMYNWIVDNLVGRKNKTTEDSLMLEDILVLHSDYNEEGTNKDLWLNHPELIADKKIVICTHAKLLNEPLHLLINSNFNLKLSDLVGPDRAAVCGYGTDKKLPRQWILIDEGTESDCIKFKITKSMMATLGYPSNRINNIVRVDPNTGRLIYGSTSLPQLRLVRRDISYKGFSSLVKEMNRLVPKNFLGQIRKEDTRLDKIRNDQFKQLLFNNFDELANGNFDETYVGFNFTDIICDGMLTHLLLFDGTSDITLSNSSKFTVLSYLDKYNSDVVLKLMPFNLDRKVKLESGINDIDLYIRSKLDNVIDSLEKVIKENNQTLIFTWMNLKSDNNEVNDDVCSARSIASKTEHVSINPNLNLSKYIATKLIERGYTEGKEFSIEYYGSGKDKAVNEYREYDSVVLLGKYQVPNSVITEFNMMYHSSITGIEYYANRVIQAICRTRIRMHKGLPINVYMTSDWSSDVINYVARYLNVSNLKSFIDIDKEKSDEIGYMYTELRKINITPKKAEQIAKLSSIDKNIFNSIISHRSYSCDMNLYDLYSIIPASRKTVDRYNALVNSLNKFMIRLNILNE